MKLTLTADQTAAIEPHIRPGWAIIGKVERETFDGSNGGTSGTLVMELGSVPTASLPTLREAIRAATAPKPEKQRKVEV